MRMAGYIKQGIVSTQFFLYGKKHFTQSGYLKHISNYNEPVQSATFIEGEELGDGVDLSGKTILVTGSNQGMLENAAYDLFVRL